MKCSFLKNFSILCGGAVFLTGCGKKETGDSSSKYESITLTSITSTCPTTVLSTTTLTYPVTTTLVTSTSSMTTSMSAIASNISSVITDLTTVIDYSTSITNDEIYNATTSTITDNDSEVLEFFNKMGNSIKDNFDSEELLNKGKSYFIYCVDFLFYDSEINGIKFSDMTDSAKQQLLCDISTIDSLICVKYPDYKENIK